jgi:anthranilate phosphoribosyltransferase
MERAAAAVDDGRAAALLERWRTVSRALGQGAAR